jgi:lipoprotein-anchoring transpeptidase ErfK/SrfK
MIQRRTLLKAAAAMPAAMAANFVLPALAALADNPEIAGFGAYITSAGDPSILYAYLMDAPSMSGHLVANLPVDTPVGVVNTTNGDMLDPNNPVWFQVVSAKGNGWVYSGLVTIVAPTTAKAADVALPPGPVPGPTGTAKSIGISLSRQHLYAYEGSTLVLDTDVTTGGPDLPTPTGLFRIMAKAPNFKFHSPWEPGSPFWYPDSPTTYALLFRSGGYYIHDAPWRANYGPGTNMPHRDPDGAVRQGSHGCVNVPFNPEAMLFNWSYVGMPVRIID